MLQAPSYGGLCVIPITVAYLKILLYIHSSFTFNELVYVDELNIFSKRRDVMVRPNYSALDIADSVRPNFGSAKNMEM